MERFLSCDWGTSSFRLRLVATEGLRVLAEEKSNDGIAGTFKNWTSEGNEESERLSFYQAYLLKQIKKLERSVSHSLANIPLLLSGMASSSIGMMELPYKELPFKTDGSDINSKTIEASNEFPHTLFIISGASTRDDVLRGEETLLAGAHTNDLDGAIIYIFPGTHSKHIHVQNGMASQFQTYMTGEFFELLSSKSILSNSVEKPAGSEWAEGDTFFEKGVLEGAASNLLNSTFHVRTNGLFKKTEPAENYNFLSGLLIGAELKDLQSGDPSTIVLVSGAHLIRQYRQALQVLAPGITLVIKDADESLLRGQWRLYKGTASHAG